MIEPEGDTAELIVYLLHFDAKLRDQHHYIGSTAYSRRFARWREHALGNGSAYTRRFIRAGIGFSVVRLFFIRARQEEIALKARPHFNRLCPLCTPTLPQPEPIHFEAGGWVPTIDAHWHHRKRPNQTG